MVQYLNGRHGQLFISNSLCLYFDFLWTWYLHLRFLGYARYELSSEKEGGHQVIAPPILKRSVEFFAWTMGVGPVFDVYLLVYR